MILRRLLCAVLACVAIAGAARADELRPGYLELTQVDAQSWKVLWKAPVLGGLATRARPALPPFCTLGPPQSRLDGAAVVAAMTATCTKDLAGAQVGVAGMDAAFTDVLLRAAPLGRRVQATRLTAANPMATIAAVPGRWQVARTYLKLGIDHILEGYDHLLFVVALMLLLRRPWQVVGATTAFTAAHSLTLAGSTLGLVGLAQAPVEALIALSIVFLAVEIAKQDPDAPRLSERAPWLIAFAFGLIHGFGFAGALREIGLPEGDVPTALLTFNIGVELGQLLVIALVLAILTAIHRLRPQALRPAILAATYGIGTTASFWLIARLWD